MRFEESKTQQVIVKYCKLSKIPVLSIPNGANVSEVNRRRLIAEGLFKGASDLFVPVPNENKHGLFVEVKTKTGKLSNEQAAFFKEVCEANDYGFCVVRSLDDFIEQWRMYSFFRKKHGPLDNEIVLVKNRRMAKTKRQASLQLRKELASAIKAIGEKYKNENKRDSEKYRVPQTRTEALKRKQDKTSKLRKLSK